MNRLIKLIVFFVYCLNFSWSTSFAQGLIKYGFEIDHNKKYASVPFKLINNLVVVDILFEGIIPLKFIVDTGLSTTVLIEKSFADILEIVPDRKLTLVGAAGGKGVEAFIVNQVSINLDGISGHNLPLLVLNEDYLQLEKSMGIKVHGILGYDLFKNFIVQIDYSRRVISFFKKVQFKRKLWFYRSLDLSIENTKPYIFQEVILEDSTCLELKLMIDTGASHALMLHQNSHDNIGLPSETLRATLGAGIAGDIQGHIGRISALNLNDHFNLAHIIVNYPDVGSYNMVIEETNRNGTIGGEILKKFSVLFDYQDSKVYLRKNKYFKKPFSYDMSGMSVKALGEFYLQPYFVIERLRQDTPAANIGLKVNDVITKMNGFSGSELSLSVINELLSSKPGKKIRLKVKRGSEELYFEFFLKELI